MKTLPKRVKMVLTAAFGTYELGRVIIEELNIGTIRCYLCGYCEQGFFAAWNEIKDFNRLDIVMFDSVDAAWDYINRCF